MALKRPPAHRADAIPVLIIHDDLAWDHERVKAEVADATAENERRKTAAREAKPPTEPDLIDVGEHPYFRYQRGDTRFDLDAQIPWRGKPLAASDYLRDDEEPTRFILRRFRWDTYHRVAGLVGKGSEANLRSCRYGLAEVEGCPDLKVDPDAVERSDEEMQRFHEFDPSLAVRIGSAAWIASQPLRESEKKR